MLNCRPGCTVWECVHEPLTINADKTGGASGQQTRQTNTQDCKRECGVLLCGHRARLSNRPQPRLLVVLATRAELFRPQLAAVAGLHGRQLIH